MKYGISIYPGLEGSLEENLSFLRLAADKKINQLFISFNIPEINVDTFSQEISLLIKTAKELKLNIISDISPAALKLLGMDNIDTAKAASLGVTTLRLDFGFTPAKIAELSHNTDNIKIQLNASTISKSILTELEKNKANFSQITALHNFYPREYTGLSEAFFTKQTKLLQSYGIEVFAFIAGGHNKRKPICAGLPTLEAHRALSVSLAARHLAALGIDGIIIGDSFPTEDELTVLSAVKKNTVLLTVKQMSADSLSNELLNQLYHARPDEAQYAIRAEEAREFIKKSHHTVEPQNNIVRSIGAVTLDNKDYLRYMGELQIIKQELPADRRSNVIAQVTAEELFLLSYITSGTAFTFQQK